MIAYLRKHSAFISFAVVLMAAPLFTSNTYYLSVLAFLATRLMIVLGLTVLMGQAGQISLGHAAFVAIGAYGSAILTTKWGMNPWLAMLAAALLAAAVAGVIGMPTLKLKGHYLAMATLGFGEIVYILLVQLRGLTNGTDGIVGIPALSLGPIDFGQPKAYHLLVWGVALILFRVALNLSDSRVGRSFRALHRAEIAAESLGVNTAFRKVQAFVISAVFASIAGSLYVHYVRFISPDTYTLTYSVLLVTSVIIGGLGNVWGAVWGSAIMILLPEFLKSFHRAQDYTNLIFGVLLVAIMIFMSGGLISIGPMVTRLWRRWRRTGEAEPEWEGKPPSSEGLETRLPEGGPAREGLG